MGQPLVGQKVVPKTFPLLYPWLLKTELCGFLVPKTKWQLQTDKVRRNGHFRSRHAVMGVKISAAAGGYPQMPMYFVYEYPSESSFGMDLTLNCNRPVKSFPKKCEHLICFLVSKFFSYKLYSGSLCYYAPAQLLA